MKKINIDVRKIRKENKKSNWHKSIFWALLFSALIYSAASLYLLYKPLTQNIKNIIDEEISSSNVVFDQNTIESLQERQNPKEIKENKSGKNPFSSF